MEAIKTIPIQGSFCYVSLNWSPGVILMILSLLNSIIDGFIFNASFVIEAIDICLSGIVTFGVSSGLLHFK